MPEYLAPGVYVEEIEGPKSIQGVSTSTAGFLGVTEIGPLKPRLVTSMTQFLDIYGSFLPHNYLAYSVDGFFKNGGRRCYIARIVRNTAKSSESDVPISSDSTPKTLNIKALGPGQWGNHVYYKIQRASNGNLNNLNLTVLYIKEEQEALPDILKKDVDDNNIIFTPDPTHPFNRFLKKKRAPAVVDKYIDLAFDLESQNYFKKLINGISNLITVNEDQPDKQPDKIPSSTIKIFSTNSIKSDAHHQKYLANFLVWNFGLNWLDPNEAPEVKEDTDIVTVTFNKDSDTLDVECKTKIGRADVILNGRKIYEFSIEGDKDVYSSNILALTGGQDYDVSIPNDETIKLSDYQGIEIDSEEPDVKDYTGLKGFEKIDDISLLFCPEQSQVPGLTDLLIDHCETLKFRFAILQENQNSHDIGSIKIERETKYAAIYYPWIGIFNEKNIPMLIPPGGHVAGIYARTDIERGVFKSPAGVEAKIRGVRSLQKQLSFSEIEVLNYKQVNSLTYKPLIGPVVWGARTMSTDVNWRYVAIRRTLSFIEKSIVNACESFVFEPNTPRLWSRVIATITPFLSNLRRDGALGGRTDEEAFFVRCDETTMTPEDIKQGKLIIRVGVRLAGVAEFVIIRISQTTGSIGEIEEL